MHATHAATPAPTHTLTPQQKLSWAVTTAAQTYISLTEQAALDTALRLDFLIGNDEHPSNICGPLSFAILRDAGILPADIDLHQTWLLNPRNKTGLTILNDLLPADRYTWVESQQSIKKTDINALNLRVGDWLYLFVKGRGYDHIVLVTRVDEAGRIYSVNNLRVVTRDDDGNILEDFGFIIDEFLLYDPTDPQAGKFYEWTDGIMLRGNGETGTGGFILIRTIAD